MTSGPESTHRVALLDACTLIPITLTNALLWLSDAGLFELLWSDTILDEVERNLPKVGVSPDRAARRVRTMRQAFGAAALVDDFDELIPTMTCDAKDRHVLAAAVRGGADALVTFNLKDFPPESAEPHGVQVVHPETFLQHILAEHPAKVVAALERGSSDLRRPAHTLEEFLAGLTATVPTFAHLAADAARDPQGPGSPVPSLMSTDDESALASMGEPGDLTNPAQAVSLWWSGVLDDLELAEALTYDPPAWGDYGWAKELLAGMSLASKVIPAVDAPGHVAFMRFVPEVATAARVFAPYRTAMIFVTVVRITDGTWRVWGLGHAMPAARAVIGDTSFVPGGGTALVLDWLTKIAQPNPPVEFLWNSLDAPLRLANAQAWLLASGHLDAGGSDRDSVAAQLSATDSAHPWFAEFLEHLLAHYRRVYSEIDGRPCLVGLTETVGPDLELVVCTSEEYVGTYASGVQIPARSFITRHLGDSRWVIAANARRLPLPGWPPTEQELSGLLIDGN